MAMRLNVNAGSHVDVCGAVTLAGIGRWIYVLLNLVLMLD